MTLTDPGPESRADDVAAALRRRGGTATSAQVASDLGLHPSTARFHLDRLVAAGRAEASREARTTRGRPHTLFTLSEDSTCGPRAYQVLSEVLVEALAAGPDPASRARSAGRRWGAGHCGEPFDLLDELGFAPREVAHSSDDDSGTDPGGAPTDEQRSAASTSPTRPRRIDLHHCPFIDLAQRHPEVVCPLHRGVIEASTSRPVELEAHPGGVCAVTLGAGREQ